MLVSFIFKDLCSCSCCFFSRACFVCSELIVGFVVCVAVVFVLLLNVVYVCLCHVLFNLSAFCCIHVCRFLFVFFQILTISGSEA